MFSHVQIVQYKCKLSKVEGSRNRAKFWPSDRQERDLYTVCVCVAQHVFVCACICLSVLLLITAERETEV